MNDMLMIQTGVKINKLLQMTSKHVTVQ